MRNISYILFLLLGLWACSDDDVNFDIMPEKGITFKPTAGGAMMYYTLPRERDVYAIKASYTNAQGEHVTKKGSYNGDSLLLDGFNESRKGVPVKVSYLDRSRNESEALELTFDTQDSAPYIFITNAKVEPSWNGFQVLYEAPEVVTGMAHVFYLGTNPLTREPDTILMQSFAIARGGDTLTYDLKQKDRTKNTVVIRVDDFKGHRVGQQVFENVESYEAVKFSVPRESWDFSQMPVVTNEAWKVGISYLFDGELKGEQRFDSKYDGYVHREFYTFLAGPDAWNKPFFVDLGTEKVPAYVRIYGMQNLDRVINAGSTGDGRIWGAYYGSKLPCEVTIYGSKDKDTWEKIGKYSQSENLAEKERWYYAEKLIKEKKELQAADSLFMDVKVRASEDTYRYLKIEVNKTFWYYDSYYGIGNTNPYNYVSMHELEVYVKKD
ncbi:MULTISPECIES: DUF4959 domain-containing protein [Butyricimonas]|uniref:DUF4959 domain-containing protein n=1 Tax=Butyricimonas TaxID=574697 RepID=UPI0007FB3B5F|nr:MULTISPECIES: DUF4959 domain-containing protein [Butyricimonas]